MRLLRGSPFAIADVVAPTFTQNVKMGQPPKSFHLIRSEPPAAFYFSLSRLVVIEYGQASLPRSPRVPVFSHYLE